MNYSIVSVQSVQKFFAVIAVLAMVLSPFANVELARADHQGYVISVSNGPTVTDNTVTVSGSSLAHFQTGNDNTQDMSVDWGDGSGWQTAPAGGLTFSPVFTDHGKGNKSFTATWSASKTYATPGTYNVKISVHHGQPVGQDGDDEATFGFQVVIEEEVEKGTLSVTKVISGVTDAINSDFSFKLNGGSSIDFSDSAYTVDLDVDTAFSVVEDEAVGFTTTYSAECSGTMTIDGADCIVTNTVIPVETCNDPIANNDGEEGECDYTCPLGQTGSLDTECVDIATAATIVIEKEVTNGSSTTVPFNFFLNDDLQFALTDGQSNNIVVTAAEGPFKVSETLPFGWSQISAECSYENQSTTSPAAVSLIAGQTVTCTFVNHDANVYGCTDDDAINHDENATVDNGSCVYPAPACTVAVVSDETVSVVEKDAFAQALDFIHTGWTATIAGATWIWGDNPVADPTATSTQTFVKTFDWNGPVTSALLDIASDNSYVVSLNGVEVANSGNDSNFTLATQDNDVNVETLGNIINGENTLSIAVQNYGTPADSNPENNPAGLLFRLDVTGNNEVDCTTVPTPDTRYTLTVTTNGDGEGNVMGTTSPDAIACYSETQEGEEFYNDCSGTYPAGTEVTIVATPDAGSNFDSSWSGACTGNNPVCKIVMNGAKAVNAHFALNSSNNGGGGNGGGGNGTRIELRDGSVRGDSTSDDEPEGQVLGEATSTLPVGAPNTGAGGSASSLVLHGVAAILASRKGVQVSNAK